MPQVATRAASESSWRKNGTKKWAPPAASAAPSARSPRKVFAPKSPMATAPKKGKYASPQLRKRVEQSEDVSDDASSASQSTTIETSEDPSAMAVREKPKRKKAAQKYVPPHLRKAVEESEDASEDMSCASQSMETSEDASAIMSNEKSIGKSPVASLSRKQKKAAQKKDFVEEQLQSQSRYKTEMCRSFEESGKCKYADRCQYAHGKEELRLILRHPKYKTEKCRSWHSTGQCRYGQRCRFQHDEPEHKKIPVNAVRADVATLEALAMAKLPPMLKSEAATRRVRSDSAPTKTSITPQSSPMLAKKNASPPPSSATTTTTTTTSKQRRDTPTDAQRPNYLAMSPPVLTTLQTLDTNHATASIEIAPDDMLALEAMCEELTLALVDRPDVLSSSCDELTATALMQSQERKSPDSAASRYGIGEPPVEAHRPSYDHVDDSCSEESSFSSSMSSSVSQSFSSASHSAQDYVPVDQHAASVVDQAMFAFLE